MEIDFKDRATVIKPDAVKSRIERPRLAIHLDFWSSSKNKWNNERTASESRSGQATWRLNNIEAKIRFFMACQKSLF